LSRLRAYGTISVLRRSHARPPWHRCDREPAGVCVGVPRLRALDSALASARRSPPADEPNCSEPSRLSGGQDRRMASPVRTPLDNWHCNRLMI
jgi:hypothetical protein